MKKGFTLIELLVVISIIALLMAIMMPTLGKAREQGRVVVCKNNLKSLGTGYMIYVQEFEYAPAESFTYPTWIDTMMPYTLMALKEFKYNQSKLEPIELLRCPSAKDILLKNWWHTHYAANTATLSFCEANNLSKMTRPKKPYLEFKQQSSVALFLDWCSGGMDKIGYVRLAGPAYMVNDRHPFYQTQLNEILRHNKKANVVFLDGHVGQIDEVGKDDDVAPWFNK